MRCLRRCGWRRRPCGHRSRSTNPPRASIGHGPRPRGRRSTGTRAAKELDTAYRLWPDPALLYNIGALYLELGRPAEAASALETYLDLEGARLSPRRRKEIEAVVAKQLAVVGTIEVRTTPEGVAVRLDDRDMGKTPLDHAIRAAQGAHELALARRGTRRRRDGSRCRRGRGCSWT